MYTTKSMLMYENTNYTTCAVSDNLKYRYMHVYLLKLINFPAGSLKDLMPHIYYASSMGFFGDFSKFSPYIWKYPFIQIHLFNRTLRNLNT